MQQRQLGTTGITLSEIGFPTWLPTGSPAAAADPGTLGQLVRMAYDRGITYFDALGGPDSAEVAERIVGEALRDVRDQVVIASGGGTGDGSWTQDSIRQSIERSLASLGMDRLDMWTLYGPDLATLRDAGFRAALESLRSAGVVGAFGLALPAGPESRELGSLAVTERIVDYIDHSYSIVNQEPGRELTDLAADNDMGVLVRSRGLWSALDTATDQPSDLDRAVDTLRFLLDDRDATMGQVAAKWLLADPGVTCALPDIADEGQLDLYVSVPEVDEFDADELGEVDVLHKVNFGLDHALTT